jgi:hypothetical protein
VNARAIRHIDSKYVSANNLNFLYNALKAVECQVGTPAKTRPVYGRIRIEGRPASAAHAAGGNSHPISIGRAAYHPHNKK